MDANTRHDAAPIFIIGSPRSGTSILTWSLGQHPNILPTEESDWLGPFTEQLAAHFEIGSARGERSQLSALGVERAAFFGVFGDAIGAMILGQRRRLEELSHVTAQRDPLQASPDFAIARDAAEPKARWVDGTPEYSFYVCGLHQLFPAARFVHILRDVDEVAASMLEFHDGAGNKLVANADDAYAYWRRTTQACVAAEAALGPNIVHRLRHADLVARPESALRELLAFLGESFAPQCLAPLAKRINSSFGDNACARAPVVTTDAIAQARQLSAQLQQSGAAAPSTEARAAWEEQFAERVRFARNLRKDYQRAVQVLRQRGIANPAEQDERIRRLEEALADKHAQLAKSQRALNACAVLLAVQFIAALIWFAQGGAGGALYPGVAGAALLGYAWLRRAGLRRLLTRATRTAQPEPNVGDASKAIR